VSPVIFTQAARSELTGAQDWYEAEAPGLGRRFRDEIDSTVRRMADNPRQFPVLFKTLRRARVNKFPYALFFSTDDDTLVVVACFHSSRNPQQWQKRV
jgi:toxin ParE1/3/4